MELPQVTEDYADHWRGMTIQGQRILDLGCDWGSTADYFLQNGAVAVVGVDSNAELIKLAEKLARPNFVPICLTINNALIIETLVNAILPDVVKVDIEGAEVNLVDVSVDVLRKPKEWVIEAHSEGLFQKVYQKFADSGFLISDYLHFVLIARKKD
jgi:predicted RNA methylase